MDDTLNRERACTFGQKPTYRKYLGAANNVKLFLIEFAGLVVNHENNSKKMGRKR